MGSLILCHKKKAKHPYEISRIHTRISTLEELCYYLCNNLYLIDYTIMNEQLCRWIADELEMQDLAVKLVELIRNHGSVEKFVVLVLHESRIYTPGEMAHIQNVLEKLKNQKEVERQKYKADKLMESGELESAILVYMSIVNGEKDDSVDKRFYGRVSACLAGAYGRAFLYEESARMYEKAYKICEDNKMLEWMRSRLHSFLPAQKKNVTGSAIFALTMKIGYLKPITVSFTRMLRGHWKAFLRKPTFISSATASVDISKFF